MLKWVLVAAGALMALLVIALAAAPWFIDTPAVRAYVAQAATRTLGRPVRFAALSVSLFPLPSVKLRGLEIGDDPAFGPDPFLTVAEGRIGIQLKPLLSGRFALTDLVLERPEILLAEDQRGRWNWASLGAGASSAVSTKQSGGRIGRRVRGAVVLSKVRIVDGRAHYRRLAGKSPEFAVEKINLTIAPATPGVPVQLQGNAVVQPGDLRVAIRDATLAPSGARSLAEMAVRARLDVDAPNVGSVVGAVLIGPSVEGAMKARLEVSGTPSRLAATGEATIERLTVSHDRAECQPRRRQLSLTDLRIPIGYAGARFDSAPVQGKLAKGTVSLRLSVALGGDGTAATVKDISVTGVDLGPIMEGFLCQSYAVTGPLDLHGDANLALADPWGAMSGSGRFRVGPGKVTGKDVANLVNQVAEMAGAASVSIASVSMSGDGRGRTVAPLEFDSITASYTIVNGVAKTDDLVYTAPDLRVTAAGTLALADGRVRMDVTLAQGPNEVKGVVSGTTGMLRVVPTSVRVQDTRGIRNLLDKLYR